MTNPPTPTQAAIDSAPAIHDLPANFMLDAPTYIAAAEVGYEGISFYVAGRGGVLGDVDADAVAEAFVFFPTETISTAWDATAGLESRESAANRFAEAAHRWAAEHMAEDAVDYRRLAELAGKVIDAADGSEAPVFSGWRELPEPTGDRELVLHRLNALRELRAARHGDAVKEVGLEPVEAFMVKSPYMASIFGWPKPDSDPDEETRRKWERAEELTNERFGADLAVLEPDELGEFCELAAATKAEAN